MSSDRIACIVIATDRRRRQVWDKVIPSVAAQGFEEVIVVGDWDETEFAGLHLAGYCWNEYLKVAPLTRSTTDALVKRDVGTLAVRSDVLVYLCDDHALAPGFGAALRAVLDEPWDVLVPNRCTQMRNSDLQGDPPEYMRNIALNNGERDAYCGGHAGVFRRDVITAKPWSAHAHHRNWDALISHEQQARGARFVWSPRAELTVVDLEPEASPWL